MTFPLSSQTGNRQTLSSHLLIKLTHFSITHIYDHVNYYDKIPNKIRIIQKKNCTIQQKLIESNTYEHNKYNDIK